MKIKIKVNPNSKKQEIKKISEDSYIVYLKQKAENNKANIELMNMFKKHLKQNIKIIKGLKSRNKIIEVDGKNEGVLLKRD